MGVGGSSSPTGRAIVRDLRTDESWEQWGRQQPYFGVLVDPAFRDVEPGGTAWQRFMQTGEEHVEDLLVRLERLGAPRRFDRAVDFGCGVGRVLAPLASRFDEVVGVDVSSAMRSQAEANLSRLGVANATVVPSDEALSAVAGQFDLVHSYNVLQHIAPGRGLAITRRLLELTRPGGAVVLHYCETAPALRHRAKRLVGSSPRLVRLAKRLRGSDPDRPIMQMFPYRFGDVRSLLLERGVDEVLVQWLMHNGNRFFQVHAAIPENGGTRGPSAAAGAT